MFNHKINNSILGGANNHGSNFFDFNLVVSFHFSTLIFIFGVLGLLLCNKNLIFVMIYIELMFVGLILKLIFIGLLTNNSLGLVYSLLGLNLAVVETVIGLSIIVLKFRFGSSLNFHALKSSR